MVQAGKMRMLVTRGSHRSEPFPDTPTLQELDGTPPAYAPFGIAAPKGLPDGVLTILQAKLATVAGSEAFKKILTQYGQEIVYMNSSDYTKFALQSYKDEAGIVKKPGLAEAK